MNRVARWLCLLIAALGVAGLARAQDKIGVSARVSSEQAFVGDLISLEVVVDGSTDARPPDLSALADFDVMYRGDENRSMTSMSIVNGRRSQSETLQYVFKYDISPRRAGALRIPSIEVTVGGKAYSTQPVWVQARAAEVSDDFILTVEPSVATTYVGQPVTLRITWYIGGQCNGGRFSGPDAQGRYDLFSGADPRPRRAGDDRYIEFSFLGNPAVGERGQGEYKGRTFNTLAFEQVLVPRQAGTVRFGPVALAFDVVTGRSRDVFDFRLQSRRMVIASEPLELTVRELPADGHPADFSGLVGAFSLRAAASPTEANVGDPISLTLRVKGPEPLASFEPPDLAAKSGFAGSFKPASDGWTESQPSGPGERVFTTTVRPMSADVKAIPSLDLSYFDPAAGEYTRAVTLPIPITVRPTSEVTAADAIAAPVAGGGRGGPALAPIERVPLGAGPAGIVDAGRRPTLLAELDADALGWIRSPAGMLVLGSPVVLFLGISAAAPIRRRLASPGRSLGRAERALRRAVRSEAPADAIAMAVREYVGRATGRIPETLTARDAGAALGGCAPSSAGLVAAVLEECEAARFGRRDTNPAGLARKAIEGLRGLDAELRSKA